MGPYATLVPGPSVDMGGSIPTDEWNKLGKLKCGKHTSNFFHNNQSKYDIKT